METLCRMESVRVNAIEQIENDEPLVADFGGPECEGLTAPTVVVEIITPTPAPEPTPTPVPTG